MQAAACFTITHVLWELVQNIFVFLCLVNLSFSLAYSIDLCRPYGFLEVFDPGYTPNTTDEGGRRYAFKEQPEIGQWNLSMLANAFLIAGLMDEVSCMHK